MARSGEERRKRILDLVRSGGRQEVQEIAAALGVAVETVRRDLRVLEDRHLLQRVHGAAMPVESGSFETAMDHRAQTRLAEKRRIAAAAVEAIGDAQTIFLDEGYTPMLIAEALAELTQPLTVVTASLANAVAIGKAPHHSVLLLGGRVRSRTLATVDHWATAMLAQLNLDLAILGANGITVESGLTTPDPAVAEVKRTAVAVSRRRIFIGIHTKFGVTSFCTFAKVQDFELLITEEALPLRQAQRFAALGPHVERV
ncbi:DeoR/GlpR family DNA-binding transcription regulator [Herbiconiux sp. KACC 21604]|uniref:DeoR/GlpR family DNA-binding transcription regulator n=1 Tax=unclassified Herbiconiux TaxID=2618217 RepID=UPI00149100EC|nr:DeoR/GlpR family DNA-binding transcription regulator [Herbiconiux sp. SALV-R1]QJU52246.1 DeoR/GlpR transcriptional regulator [Herbiconiux sp. SALV-R1]WPO87091.1 DeoR/GlpR family DNA-binding transcription regulator [Herbiconiux sp. KACC 21604]